MVYWLLGIGYLYFVWRNLRDNYPEEKLVAFGWWSLLLFIAGSRLTFGLVNWGVFDTVGDWWNFSGKPGTIWGGGILSVSLFCWYLTSQNNWKLWSFMEDILPLSYLILAVLNFVEKNFIIGGILVVGFGLTWIFGGKYRSYPWYTSGRKGFNVGAVGFIVGLLLMAYTVVFKQSGVLLIIYAIFSLLSLTQLVILGDIWHKK